MKWIIAILVLVILALQYRLWFGEGSLEQMTELSREIERQKVENANLRERNRILMLRVRELKQGEERVEEKAREDMGMIQEGETFFFIPEDSADTAQ